MKSHDDENVFIDERKTIIEHYTLILGHFYFDDSKVSQELYKSYRGGSD